jgi:glycosyltransferase involved in cell wall biosynthesis
MPPNALPSVSVVMPCFNAGPYITAAIDSVLAQRYEGPLEILVVDDGSTDASVSVAAAKPQVRVLQQSNQGPAAARNRGIQAATGELIAFLDADDQWLPGSLLPRVLCLVQRPEIGVAFADFTRWTPADDAGGQEREVPERLPAFTDEAVRSGWLYPEILLDTIVHIITAVVRREVFVVVGDFDVGLRMGEDYQFWIRAAQQFRFAKLDLLAARYRLHASGTTRVPRAENHEYRVTTGAMAQFGLVGQRGTPVDRELLARRLHRMCFNHALLHAAHGSAAVAAANFRQAARHRPLHLKAWAFWLRASVKARAMGAVDARQAML